MAKGYWSASSVVGIVLPNLFIVGAPKCGTTAWVSYLQSHPDIFFATKEPHYFSFDFPGFRMVSDSASYADQFANAGAIRVRGDASVMYLYSQVAANEIARAKPDARILIFVRRQEEFLPSFHNQLLYNGIESIEDFEKAWRLSDKRDNTNTLRWCSERKFLNYHAAGRFYEQVERYFAQFPADRIRVFHFDDWVRNPRPIYLEILRLLELPDDGRTEFPRVNAAKRHKSQWLGKFTQSPPPWALKASSLVKKLTGSSKPPLVDSLRRINLTQGYRTARPSQSLIEEIRAHYAADNALLEPRIWRPS